MKVKLENKNVSFVIPDGLKKRTRKDRPKREEFVVSDMRSIIKASGLTNKDLYHKYYSVDAQYYIESDSGEIIGFETDYRCNECNRIVVDMWNHLIIEHLFKEEFSAIKDKCNILKKEEENVG